MSRIFGTFLVFSMIFLIVPVSSSAAEMAMGDKTLDDVGLWSVMRPDGHAPGGVMVGNLHHAGRWMLSYRLQFMDMEGNRDGTDRLSVSDVFAGGYGVSPTDMTMQMHVVGVMYSPSEKVTLIAMIPYMIKEMDHRTSLGFIPAPDTTFTTRSDGLADIKLTGLIPLMQSGRHRIHLGVGLSFPTGSIDEKDDLPPLDGNDAHLPYPMQLGSGTYDLLGGLTYSGQAEHWSWGGQAGGTLRTGENDNDYSLGDTFALTSWVARKWSQKVSTSLRVNGQIWGNIEGNDSKLAVPAAVNPTADPNLRAGKRWDLLLGANIYLPGSGMKGHRLFFEGGMPIYQDLDGPQLETDWVVTFVYKYAL